MEVRHRQIVLGCILAIGMGTNLSWHAQASEATAAPDTIHTVSTAEWASLFDPAIDVAERRHALDTLERHAGTANGDELYLLGSLYHMGQHAPGSPVDADSAKAAMYFANAAVRGNVLAMAKVAEVKYSAGDYREAMNWAQIYAHYAPTIGMQGPAAQSYAGELVQRIKDNISEQSMDAIMADVSRFVAANDKAIRAGIAGSGLDEPALHPNSHKRHFTTSPNERDPGAGVADFLVAFRRDGTVDHVQLLDSVPYMEGTDRMRTYVASMNAEPGTAGDTSTLRYIWMPIVMGNRLYHTREGR
ncbi:MAG TPA: hypothetical protein VFG49_08575 [Dyella sp.]|uniref:hypothetical protein n=1 Tax=Dyella sp. TaxID=1869338 RepID=UPI002D773BDB|nr:hypothetical protein [Dyella sp.]HET6553578.1 hypothetical protein [Dyella sp.]